MISTILFIIVCGFVLIPIAWCLIAAIVLAWYMMINETREFFRGRSRS